MERKESEQTGLKDSLVYQIGLSLVPGIGTVLGKKLVKLCGSAERVFTDPGRCLGRFPRIREAIAAASARRDLFDRVDREMEFLERYTIRPLFFQDPDYPRRLRNCYDAPLMLYYKGCTPLNQTKIVGIVGTRNATDYGKAVTRELIGGLVRHEVLIVSGLAYGIDGCAHRSALESGLSTVGVLGHGLDMVYPWAHRPLAGRMVQSGGLLSEFMSQTRPDRNNFPKRNRIIAGLCDALVVVEAGSKGGALITADIANSYNRDVFAVPGRVTDPFSEGTNLLIRTNRASLIQKPEDIEYLMGWDEKVQPAGGLQRKIFPDLSPEEEVIVGIIREAGKAGIDDVCIRAGLPMSRVSASLLHLEFEGIVNCMPGKVYMLV